MTSRKWRINLGRGVLSYFDVAIVTMTRRSSWNISAVLKIYQMSAHVIMAPGVIPSEFGNVVPLVVRGPGEVHGVDLGATAKCCAPRIQNTQAEFAQRISLNPMVHLMTRVW